MVDKRKEAIRLMEEQKYEEAAKVFIQMIDEEPNDPIGYINFANLLSQMRQYGEAERFYLKAIQLDEKTATAFYGLGNLYYEKSLFPEAEKSFKQAIHLGLLDSDVYFMLGMTYVKNEKLTLALPFLQRATELDEDVQKLFQYGLVLAQLHYLKEAEKVLLRVIDIQQHHPDALYNLGIIAVHHKQYREAIDYFDHALSSKPDHLLAKKAKASVEKGIASE